MQFASDNSAMMPSYTYRRTTMMKARQVGQTKRRWIKWNKSPEVNALESFGSCRTSTSGSRRSFPFHFFLLSFLGNVVFNSFRKKGESIHSKSVTVQRLTTLPSYNCTITIFIRTPADGKTTPPCLCSYLLFYCGLCSFLLAYNEKFGGESPGIRWGL